jgi:hypothetical protein
MAAGVTPRLEMIAYPNGFETKLLGQHAILEQLRRTELLRG